MLCVHPRALTEPALGFGPWEVRDPFVWCYGPGTEETRPPHRHPLQDYFRLGFLEAFGRATGGFDHYANQPVFNRNGKSYNTLAAEMTAERGYWEQPGTLKKNWKPRKLIEEPFTMHPANKEGLHDLARLARDNGILFLIRLAPLVDGDGAKDSQSLQSWTKELEAEFPTVIVSRPEVLHYDASYFSDIDHCNRSGAAKFTAFVTEEVQRALARR